MHAHTQDQRLSATLGATINDHMSMERWVAHGRRYAGRGVRSAHSAVIVQTLLWVLEQPAKKADAPCCALDKSDTHKLHQATIINLGKTGTDIFSSKLNLSRFTLGKAIMIKRLR